MPLPEEPKTRRWGKVLPLVSGLPNHSFRSANGANKAKNRENFALFTPFEVFALNA